MGTWTTRGLRGSTLEEMINRTNEKYREKKLALVQKIPTPITPININKETSQITLAYFEQKSTVDYIGVMGGIPICFDAKECGKKSLPFSNIHPHQVSFMSDFDQQGGIAFLLVHFTEYGETYVLPVETLKEYYGKENGRSSIPYQAFSKELLVPDDHGTYLNYLVTVFKYTQMKSRGEFSSQVACQEDEKSV